MRLRVTVAEFVLTPVGFVRVPDGDRDNVTETVPEVERVRETEVVRETVTVADEVGLSVAKLGSEVFERDCVTETVPDGERV